MVGRCPLISNEVTACQGQGEKDERKMGGGRPHLLKARFWGVEERVRSVNTSQDKAKKGALRQSRTVSSGLDMTDVNPVEPKQTVLAGSGVGVYE